MADFQSLTDDALQVLFAHCASSSDIFSFSATCKAAQKIVLSPLLWGRAFHTRWPEIAQNLDEISKNTTKIVNEASDDDTAPMAEAEPSLLASAEFLRTAQGSSKFNYIFMEHYEQLIDYFVANKSEDDYFEAPSKRPYASGVASLASHLYGSSLSQNKPPEGQHKLIIDLFVALFRFKPNRSIRWNMGKCLTFMISSEEYMPYLLLSMQKYTHLWTCFLTHCMRVPDGPSKAPSFYLYQEIRRVVVFAVEKTADVTRQARILRHGIELANQEIAAFTQLSNPPFPEHNISAALMFVFSVLQGAKEDVLSKLPAPAESIASMLQSIQTLETFISSSDAYKKAAQLARERADPHHAHHPAPQIFSSLMLVKSSVIVRQNNSENLLKFVEDTLNSMKATSEENVGVMGGLMQALVSIFSALRPNKPLSHQIGERIFEFSIDYNIPMLVKLLPQHCSVSLREFPAFGTRYVPKVIENMLSNDNNTLRSLGVVCESFQTSFSGFTGENFRAFPLLADKSPLMASKIVSIICNVDPEVMEQYGVDARDVAYALGVLSALGDAFGAPVVQEIAHEANSFGKLLNLITVAFESGGSMVAAVAAQHAAAQIEQQEGAVKALFEKCAYVFNGTKEGFNVVAGLGVENYGDEGVSSYSVAYWAFFHLASAFPQVALQNYDAALTALSGLRAWSPNMCENMALAWVALIKLDASKTLETLKIPGNGLFFVSQLCRMTEEAERRAVLDAIASLRALDSAQVDLWITHALKPSSFEEESSIIAMNKTDIAQWQEKQELAHENNDWDFGYTPETKQPHAIREIPDATPEQRDIYTALISATFGAELANKIA